MFMTLYTVEMLNKGDRASHSYVLGVYGTTEMAEYAGQVEEVWMNGLYQPVITPFDVNEKPHYKKIDLHKLKRGYLK
jgi:hypothetical protein